MGKTNKISNLKRLNLKNKCIVIRYLLKTILRIKPSENENNAYIYYNILINSDGYFVEETKNEFITEIKSIFIKRIKTRKKPKSSDLDVFKMIYVAKEYLPAIIAYEENFNQRKDYLLNIIDAGSNIGLTTLFFLDYFKKANIVCVEPEKENFKILEYNLNNNNENNIVKINGAVWSSNTKIKIINDFKDKKDWSFRVEETDDLNGIKAFSINKIIKDNNFRYLDILKIDIEGAEKEVFNPEISDLSFLRITRCIVMEIHDYFDCRKNIYSILDEYGFSYFNKGELTICINRNLQ